MRYTLQDCLEFYDFFNQDFFYEELGKKLKKCQLTVKVTEARKIRGNLVRYIAYLIYSLVGFTGF